MLDLEAVRLILARFVSTYFLSHNTIHSTSRILFIKSAEHHSNPSLSLQVPSELCPRFPAPVLQKSIALLDNARTDILGYICAVPCFHGITSIYRKTDFVGKALFSCKIHNFKSIVSKKNLIYMKY